MNAATHVSDESPIEVLAPFVRWLKRDIAGRGSQLKVPFDLTLSCYEGGDEPYGNCSTCIDRELVLAKNHDLDN